MNRTVLLALDGATFRVLDPMMEEGVMPFFRRLVAGGVRAVLASTANPLTPPAFVSMFTGRSPGHHGIFDFTRVVDHGDRVDFPLYDSGDIRCETIWSLASRQDRTITALNFVLTATDAAVAGCIVPGMVQWKQLKRRTTPPSLYDELKAQRWFDPKVLCWDFKRERAAVGDGAPTDKRQWVMDHIERERQWFNVLRHVMEKKPTDLTAIVFDGMDKVQHLCWEFLDASFDPPDGEGLKALTRDYFRALDGFLEKTVERAGPGARVFVVSDHGFGPNRVTFHVNQWLHDRGYLHWKDRAGQPGADSALDIDWSRTVAYCPRRSINGIYIRVARRADAPGISPGEYASFRERLIAELRACRVPQTGGPLVREVWPREEVFAGPAMPDAPDITLALFDNNFVSTLPSASVVEDHPPVRGTHYPDGIFVAAGDGIRQGHALDQPLSILDVAPAVLHSLGLAVPANFEGTVPAAAFDPAFLEANPVRGGEPAGEGVRAAPREREKGTPEEEAAVYAQLKALGYVE
jgi:predicted AlkP superfamily phosphohydrolase/phosphomutase